MTRRYVVEFDETYWLCDRPHDVTAVVEAYSPDVAIRRVMHTHHLSFVADAWTRVEGGRWRSTYRCGVSLPERVAKAVPS